MAPPGRQDPDHLIAELQAQPWRFDFFQGLRAIECAFREQPRIGRSRTLRDDAIRFGQFVSMAFATGTWGSPELQEVDERKRKSLPPKLLIRFTGLTGTHGPLPLRLTEFVRNRQRGIHDPDVDATAGAAAAFSSGDTGTGKTLRDTTLAEFLDIFHHRMISLFYRAWAVAQKTVDFDRAAGDLSDSGAGGEKHRTTHSDRQEDRFFAEWIACLFGVDLPEYDGLDSIPTWRKLAFAGHLANQTRHAGGLEGLLTEAFSTPAEIRGLTGHWIAIPEDQRCRLGEDPGLGTLGRTCVVGSRIWDRRMKFTASLGPMSFVQFETFLPGGDSHQPLHDWIAFYTRREFYWEAEIVLKKDEVPKIALGQAGRLGYTTWLSSHAFKDHAKDYRVRGGGLTPAENS